VALDRVKPLKIESIATGGDTDDEYPTSLDPEEDHIECAGIVLDDPGAVDETTVIDRNGTDMRFKDGHNPAYLTLSDLYIGAGGLDYIEFLLDNEPILETGATDATYILTRALGQVSKEEWKRNNGTYIKTIDYTYAVGKLATEVRKVFAADGLTVVAQVTWTYIYGGGLLTGATMTRDV